MKYFKYWAEEQHKIRIEGQSEKISLLVGSSLSKEDVMRKIECAVGEKIVNINYTGASLTISGQQ